MPSRISLFLICTLWISVASAQNLSISSDSFVCVKDLISFRAISNQTIVSESWSFGDGFTSNQQNPSHIYNNIGLKTVTVEAVFSGGSTKSVSRQIMVHDLPQPQFELNDSLLCFGNHNLCIEDNSTMGLTTSGYASRLILWGDGARSDAQNPINEKEVCYSSYPKPDDKPYTINIEISNDKGCEARWSANVFVKEDYVPSFVATRKSPECNAQEVCLQNDSATKSAAINRWHWNFGGEKRDSVNWSNACYTFETQGSKTIQLYVELENGCKSYLDTTIQIAFPVIKTDVKVADSVLCFPETFTFSNPLVPGANYTWELYSIDTTPIRIAGYNIVQRVVVTEPGDYLVRLQLRRNNCTEYSPYIKISSLGTIADFTVLNGQQCEPKDTVYFYNQSRSHPSSKPIYYWDFKDENASNCIGYKQNCNFDTAFHTRHFYSDTNCYVPQLLVKDTASGCVDSVSKLVAIVSLEDVNFDYKLSKPCIGGRKEYEVLFTHNKCNLKVRAVYDSLTDQEFDEFLPKKTYAVVKDSNGFVTVGFAVQAGSEKKFLSSSLTDYVIDSSSICRDTLWYHNWLQLHPEPDMAFAIHKDAECLPVNATLQYFGQNVNKLKELRIRWGGVGVLDTFPINDTLPTVKHLYTEEGEYDVFIQLEDTFGCYDELSLKEQLGYYNSFNAKEVLCFGDTARFIDSVFYWNNSIPYWRENNGIEKLRWDFGDGNGFTDSTPSPSHYYTAKGRYTVQLATKDRKGCTDTASLIIEVGGVNASIADKNKTYLCSQIIQFFDSSYFDHATTNDKIESYFWDFGDSTRSSYLKNPSHLYNGSENFTLTHAVKSEAGCIDTAEFTIYIKGPEPYFDILFDTIGCVPFEAKLKSNSNLVSNFVWRLGDENGTTFYSSRDTSFSFQYRKPGIYYIYLDGSDSFYNEDTKSYYTCSSVFPDTTKPSFETRRVIVKEIPPVDFNFQEPVCVNQQVNFIDASNSRYTSFNWLIDGVTQSIDNSVLSHTFRKAGEYEVWLKPTYIPDLDSERYCFDSIVHTIRVSEVQAKFSYQVEERCSKVVFKDSSVNAVAYSWDFDHPASSKNLHDKPNAEHIYYPDTGYFSPCLIVENTEGCRDTFCEEVYLQYYEDLKLYNVYTPENDGINDVFFFDTHNTSLYHLRIYNRWGELVFETKDPTESWAGKDKRTGEDLPASTYFYILHYSFYCDNQKYLVEGTVELIR